MSLANISTTVQFNYRPSNDLFLRKLPASRSFDFGPQAPLVVVAVFIALLVLGEVGQFLLAHRQLSTGQRGNYVILPWLWYLGTPQFFTKECRYLAKALQRFPGSWFRFRVRENDVVIVSGSEARHVFFNCQSLTFLEGYFLLHPNMRYLLPEAYTDGKDGFGWLLKQFARVDVLQRFLAPTVADAQGLLTELGKEGIMDPFTEVDRAVFSVAMRIAAGNEIADEPEKLSAVHRALSWLQKSSTPHAHILPWIPTPARFRGVIGALKLHRMLSEVFSKRKRHSASNNDVLQSLVDEDVSATQASVLTIMTILAAHTNTSAILSWLIITLVQHPTWLAAVRAEVDAFLSTHHVSTPSHSPSSIGTPCPTDSPSDIPFVAWERALPTLDLCLQECLRLYMNVPLIRRNTGEDIEVAGRTIASGDYVMYMMEDAHLDAAAYPEPMRFDPLRDRSRAGKSGFVAWGAGTHPCTGQRLAKLIIKVFVSLLLWNYDLELVDARGELLKKAPQPVMGLFSVPRPDADVRVRYKERVYGARTP
ncbi:cytochrome P450 [Fomitopsis serialis]|uniref:cytochrome P450 n=1 Tax=Fomitopsis serialis TaxID=139415 RepID=UPI0020082794|nr:cytochrome P450 [Neoantrodia serialis]KAH9918973.1 cytochrome P450 [Neoantrodia serialis]